jgi:hypothetical protein
VLAPAVGAFLDLEQRLGRTWVRTYVGELTATTLAAALAAGAPGGPAPLDDFAWSTIARQTLGAYQNLRQ